MMKKGARGLAFKLAVVLTLTPSIGAAVPAAVLQGGIAALLPLGLILGLPGGLGLPVPSSGISLDVGGNGGNRLAGPPAGSGHGSVFAGPNPQAQIFAPDAFAPACRDGFVNLTESAVYTLINARPFNQVLAFDRAPDGTLCQAGIFSTAGGADNSGIATSGQDAVIAEGGYLFAVNAANLTGFRNPGSVSVFRIEAEGLVLTDIESSGNLNPRSVTRHGDLVYVVNAGIPTGARISESVRGFRFDDRTGDLTVIPGSDIATIDPAGDPAQIGFTPDGRFLVISQRNFSEFRSGNQYVPQYLEVMTMGNNGLPVEVNRFDVVGERPFGFRFADNSNILYLTNGPSDGRVLGGISSHRIDNEGDMSTLTAYTRDGGFDTCWNYLSQTTRTPYMYTSAFLNSAIGQWQIESDGQLRMINPTAASSSVSGQLRPLADIGGLDMEGAVDSNGNEYLYVINSPVIAPLGQTTARLVGFRIDSHDGQLLPLGDVARNLLNSTYGLVAY